MPEQRRDARNKMFAFTPVYDFRLKALLGFLVDLTIQGARVETNQPMEVNKLITLSMEFPSGLSDASTSPFTIAARVVRCFQDEGLQNYHIGFEFIDIKPDQTKIIQAIIQRYTFHQ